MPPPLFDPALRALRRDRAARLGPELFLYERVFEDCVERIAMMQRGFRRALLIGCPARSFAERLAEFATDVDVLDPGELFASAAGGSTVLEDAWEPEPGAYDLALAIGTLDSINDLPRALLALRFTLGDDALLLGAAAGGDTLPQLRAALRAADAVSGAAMPHVHPRIDPAAFTGLLAAAGFERPVVDVDRVSVAYSSLERLLGDLRRMAAGNILTQRSRSLTRAERDAAVAAFASAGADGRTIETFEILHFAGWTPAAGCGG